MIQGVNAVGESGDILLNKMKMNVKKVIVGKKKAGINQLDPRQTPDRSQKMISASSIELPARIK